MKVPQLKERMDKLVYSLSRFEDTNFRGEKPLSQQYRDDLKEFAVLALEGMLREVEQYGTNTHSASAATAFMVEFRNKI